MFRRRSVLQEFLTQAVVVTLMQENETVVRLKGVCPGPATWKLVLVRGSWFLKWRCLPEFRSLSNPGPSSLLSIEVPHS